MSDEKCPMCGSKGKLKNLACDPYWQFAANKPKLTTQSKFSGDGQRVIQLSAKLEKICHFCAICAPLDDQGNHIVTRPSEIDPTPVVDHVQCRLADAAEVMKFLALPGAKSIQRSDGWSAIAEYTDGYGQRQFTSHCRLETPSEACRLAMAEMAKQEASEPK